MQKKISLIILLTLVLLSCNSKVKTDEYHYMVYRAIHNKDTAILSLNINDKRFYGQYEVSHYKIGKDSGDVRGRIEGDTLYGLFNYISYGGGLKRMPLAFLKKKNQLFLGTGVIGTYMNIPCFIPEIPIQYDNAEFVFKEINTPLN